MSTKYKFLDPDGIYFVTFSTVAWVDVFTRPLYCEILCESVRYCQENKGLNLHAWCLMSNHVHCIVSTEANLSDIVRDFKKYTSKTILKEIESSTESRKKWLMMIFKYHAKFNKRVNEVQFWTHENHAVELTTNQMIDSRINYIHQNPVRAAIVENDFEYLYSSARNSANLESLLAIDEL